MMSLSRVCITSAGESHLSGPTDQQGAVYLAVQRTVCGSFTAGRLSHVLYCNSSSLAYAWR